MTSSGVENVTSIWVIKRSRMEEAGANVGKIPYLIECVWVSHQTGKGRKIIDSNLLVGYGLTTNQLRGGPLPVINISPG